MDSYEVEYFLELEYDHFNIPDVIYIDSNDIIVVHQFFVVKVDESVDFVNGFGS